jgi:predicted RNA binding protein YcfA (HicA-like mRNA interferase family)
MKSSQLVKLLKKDGWRTVRQGKGSHLIMEHPEKNGTLSVPSHGSREVGTGLMNRLLKDAGLK